MNVSPIITRLRDRAPSFKVVGGAADYDAATEALIATPAAYVIELATAARQEGSYTLTVVTQIVQVTVAVVIAVSMQQDTAGGVDKTQLQTAREAARTALLGYQMTPDNEPLTYVGGQLLDFEPGTLWWQDVYVTTETITNRDTPE